MKYTSMLKRSLVIALLAIGTHSFSQTTPASIPVGTIPAGDSIIIVYAVTVNTPFTNNPSQVSNQGSISGSNFTSLVTNDPKTPAANDATVTTIVAAAGSTITDYFRTRQTGDWGDVNTWESSTLADFSSGVVSPATLTPTSASNVIDIQTGHTVTVADDVTTDQTFVNANAILKVSATKTLTVSGNGLTIRSTSAGTGSIGTSAGAITGDVTVERYIPSKRAYRLLAPSVTAGTIRDNWQEGGTYTAGLGTHITGSTSGANGFDATQTGQASLFTYQYGATGSTDSYQPVSNTDVNTLNAANGYLLYVRGDRTPSNIGAAATTNNTTLRATGTLRMGDVPHSLQGHSRFTLVPNPYASALNWESIFNDAVNTRGLENYYTYLDPNLGSGGYVTVTNGGTSSLGTTNSNNLQIQSGQAFFVKSTVSGIHGLTITEAHKSSVNNRTSVFRTGTPEQMGIALFYRGSDGTRRIADGVNVLFNNSYSSAVDGNDAEEIANFDENLAITRGGKMLSIEGRPLAEDKDTITLDIARTKQQTYEFEITPSGISAPGLQAVLQDKYLNKETTVDLVSKTIMPFSITTDAASKAADRFLVVFRQGGVLPVTMSDVKAYRKAQGVEVEWTTLTENNVAKYEVEKSADGTGFTNAASVKAKGNSNTQTTYNWFDATPLKGYNYYRIKTTEHNGHAEYSKVVRVNIEKTGGSIVVYPNPVKGNKVSVQLDIEKGQYAVILNNKLGQQIYKTTISHDGGSATQTLTLPASLAKGVYQLQVLGADMKITHQLIRN